VQHDKKLLPYEIVSVKGKPSVRVSYMGQPKTFSPEEVSAVILIKMKETAEGFLGRTLVNAVVTVCSDPARSPDRYLHPMQEGLRSEGLCVTLGRPFAGKTATLDVQITDRGRWVQRRSCGRHITELCGAADVRSQL
jgi:hypothetical protein